MYDFDDREFNYDRILVDIKDIGAVPGFSSPILCPMKLAQKSIDPPKKPMFWVYVQHDPIPPNNDFPIIQSYVDIILRGCLTYGENFAISFLNTTHGWPNNYSQNTESMIEKDPDNGDITEDNKEASWVDDRHDPQYVRADPIYSNEEGENLDNMLREYHPLAFSARQNLI